MYFGGSASGRTTLRRLGGLAAGLLAGLLAGLWPPSAARAAEPAQMPAGATQMPTGTALMAAGPAVASKAPAVFPPIVGTTEQQGSDGRSGLGLSGYDPLTYLLEAAPRAGLARLETVWAGLAWRFATPADRAAFLRDPEAFLPRVGGYDALAIAAGQVVDADPLVYAVRDGRLYLFRSALNRDRFLADPPAAEAAERGWATVRGSLVRG